ncbi:quinohemoprotein amine dehydrogenase subunit alpha [Novosphingobium humi]|uniref:quinohemoprotein amine dehydrogenase subunit alpha n=1 Tax=Novosphingobium humi TaxID=2282397 RepID=UPI00338D69BF
MTFPSDPSDIGASASLNHTPSKHRRRLALLGLTATALGMAVLHGAGPAVAQADEQGGEKEAGIPVTDKLVIDKCGACHTNDGKGNLSRISWMRTTPEGWAQAIHRMVKLNGLVITAEDAKKVIRSLSASHGLAPDEAKPVMYLTEKRVLDETNIPNETVRAACASCHAFAQPLSWRRSANEWKLLQEFHIALYSQAEVQYRRGVDEHGIPQGYGAPAAKGPTPGEVALEYMRKVAPLHSAEWASWSARMRPAALAGKWLVSADLPGKGRYAGSMVIAPKGDDFTTTITLKSLKDGSTITRTGSGIVYSGYSWRGTSKGAGDMTSPDAPTHQARETMWFAPDQKSAAGRWYWGAYQEFGFDVKLTRATADPTIASVSPDAVKTGTMGAQLHIIGDKLPTKFALSDITLGKGVVARKIVSAGADEIVLSVDVAPDAAVGAHDVAIGGAVLEKALPIYKKVDYIKVTPETSLARLGGSEKHPKGYLQFEAIGYDKGADGKAGTADDVAIGPIDATFSMSEFPSVYYDDDVNFVGKLSTAGFFTPNIDGPNPQRKWNRNNYGEVWVTATAKTEKGADGKPLTAKAFMVVTVPAYKRWDQPEVNQ